MLDVWITGGGTREPIDAVRYVGNRSTGRLATALAREAASRGHRVTLFLAAGLPEPGPGVEIVRFETHGDLQSRLLEDRRGPPSALLHAAAVADYAPRSATGKVPSGRSSWSLVLEPLAKLAPQLRRRFPDAVLVLFKLETGLGDPELRRRALAAARRSGADLVFANRLEEVGADHRGWLLDPADGGSREVRGREAVAGLLLDEVERRCVREESGT